MERILREKRIDTLYHFTRAENLKNIFRYGIMPRDDLEKREITSSYNDHYRYDECLDAVCTSIEFPNYKMFYKLRVENKDTDWVVLKLSAKIMCDFECAYCWTNAGDASMYGIPIKERTRIDAFLGLFEDKEGYPKRESLHINDWYPTNPQAEVLVFGTIPTKYIECVCFKDDEERKRYREVIPVGFSTSVCMNVYGPRKDWEAWQI